MKLIIVSNFKREFESHKYVTFYQLLCTDQYDLVIFSLIIYWTTVRDFSSIK